jgi:squalene synthase HpnC
VDDFAAVYAFCRWADDLGDETGNDAAARRRSIELLNWWRHELDLCFTGRASHPVMIALAQTVRRHDLPAQPFVDLIEAFRLDQSKTRYATWEELMAYCRLSADPVGRIILMLGSYRAETHPELFALSDLGCSALQITNHLQDCGRDLTQRGEGGRVYLPTEVTGLDAEALLAMRRGAGIGTREDRAAFARAITPLWERTEGMYREALRLPERLGRDLRAVVWLMLQGGHQTHAAIKADGMCPLWRRPRLSRPRAAWLVARAASFALARMVRA